MTKLSVDDFEKPSPGNWVWDHTHQAHPHPPLIQDALERGMGAGFRGAFESVGSLLETIESRHVHGWVYQAARPIGAPPEPKGPPPWLIFKLATTFHPELRRRIRRASQVWETKPWKESARVWAQIEPDHRQSLLELQRFDRDAADADALRKHLVDALALFEAILRDHFLEGVPAGVPIGDLFVQAEERAGLSASRVAGVLAGASPETSRPTRLMLGIVDELATAGDLDLLDGEDHAAVVARLQAHASAGDRMTAYLDEYGYRALELNIDRAETLIERPDIIVRTLRGLRDGGDHLPGSDPGLAAATAIAEELADEDRAWFDSAVAEAREGLRHRESSANLAGWALGVVRLAALELGTRLCDEGLLNDPIEIFVVRDHELGALPDVEDLRARQALHDAAYEVRPPRLLGVEAGPPPADWLPAPVARLQRAVDAYVSRFDAAPDLADGDELTGLGVSPGVVAGQVFLLEDFDKIDEVPAGCILVTKSTNPSLNPVLPIIGGLVTELGGLICHAAIMARELGFPGVVGCPAALSLEHDSWIEIDGSTGVVRRLDGPVQPAQTMGSRFEPTEFEPVAPKSAGSWAILSEATDVKRFGGKAARLAAALSAGHRVPDGIALDVDFVEAIAAGDPEHLAQLETVVAKLAGPLAVRSSAPAEDGSEASFAGMHHTALGVAPGEVADTVAEVWRSGVAPAAQAYRARRGIAGRPQMAVLIQELVPADASGVRFGCDPVTGEDVRIVESAFGLGSLVVDGRVKPDRVRLTSDGEVIERTAGETPIKLVPAPDGGVCEVPVTDVEKGKNPVHNGLLKSVHELGEACDALFAGAQDVEWAVVEGEVWLLQSRPVTTGGSA